VERHPLVDLAEELVRLSESLAEALEAGDLDAAEMLVIERGRLLEIAGDMPVDSEPIAAAHVADIRHAMIALHCRCTAALNSGIGSVHAGLGNLATGARAMRAYLGRDPLAPGFVDRRD
jgi:hypothetical protein